MHGGTIPSMLFPSLMCCLILSMIGQIEEQQTLMAEMILEMQNRDNQLSLMQEQNQKLQKLNSELSELLNILPNTE